MECLILSMPSRRFISMGSSIMHRLTDADIQTLRTACHTALRRYFGEEL